MLCPAMVETIKKGKWEKMMALAKKIEGSQKMSEKLKKYTDLLEELQKALENEKKNREDDIDLRIGQTMRELRQMIERLRCLKDGESLTYEDLPKEEPKI